MRILKIIVVGAAGLCLVVTRLPAIALRVRPGHRLTR